MTGQCEHTDFARSIWSTAGPVFPTGKNSSGSTVRQAALSRQSMVFLTVFAGDDTREWCESASAVTKRWVTLGFNGPRYDRNNQVFEALNVSR